MKVSSPSKLDLDLLLKAAQDDDLRARKLGDDVYVDWVMLRPKMPFGPASHAAEGFLPVLNGMLGMRFPAFNGLKLQSILGVDENGQWLPVSWASTRLSAQNQVEHAMAYLQKGGPTIGPLYQLATANPAVGEALLYFGRDSEPFFNLYKALEVIRDSVGGQDRLEGLGIASRSECERFTHSANDPAISGVLARHPQKSTAPITNPMNEHQAREFLRTTLQRWMDYLASLGQQQGSPT